MDNQAYDSGSDDGLQELANQNELTLSSLGASSGISLSTPSSSRTTPSRDSIDQLKASHHHQHHHHENEFNPISISRPILFTKDFYPLSKTKQDNQTQIDAPADVFQKPARSGNLFTNAIAPLNPFKKSSSSKPSEPLSIYSILCTIFPIIKWLSTYSVRDSLLYDTIAGVTILALHIPQGLAYGRLAGAEPINGLYVSLFPVVVYAIFGGSRQISIGTFAVISIACRDVIEQITGGDLVDGDQDLGNHTFALEPNHSQFTSSVFAHTAKHYRLVEGEKYASIEILTALCLLVGLIQFLIGLLRLGVLATLLSDPIISSFCVGASVHVLTSQVFALFGIDSSEGANEPKIPFELVRSWYRLFSRIPSANPATIIISIITMSLLYSCKTYLEPYLMKRFKLKSIAIPIDILSIVVLTVMSSLLDFHGRWDVPLIPKVSAGFEGMPVLPRVALFPKLITSAILLAFICYASTYSLEKMYARKNGYQVHPNQELFAMGLANIVSSFFLCFPSCGSLARSAVQDKVGGKTQMASLISSGLIVVFILFLSAFLETLPQCALACIINIALISTFKKITEFWHYWKISKLDGLVWVATFLLVVLFGVDHGLLYGLAVGLAMLIFRLAIPTFNLKYHVPNTECYLERSNDKEQSTKSSGVMIFEFHGPLLFINVDRFKKGFQTKVFESIEQQSSAQLSYPVTSPTTNTGAAKLLSVINLASPPYGLSSPSDDNNNNNFTPQPPQPPPTHTVIFDMHQVPYLDAKGVECLSELESELAKLGPHTVRLYLAGPSRPVLDTLILCQFFTKFDQKRCFLTVHDAVISATMNSSSPYGSKMNLTDS